MRYRKAPGSRPMCGRRRVFIAICVMLLIVSGAFAQGDVESSPSLEKTPAGPSFRSPRAAMNAFLHGVNAGKEAGLQDVLGTLDLSRINPEVREEVGWELAVKLKRVLDRYAYVDIDQISNDSTGEPYVALEDPAGTVVIDLVLDPALDRDVWKFTAASLDQIDALYEVYKDKPLAPGVREDQTPVVVSVALRDWIEENVPFLLREDLFLENWQWVGLFAIILAGMVASRFLCFLLLVLLRRLFAKQDFSVDSDLERDFVRPIRIALMAWVWLLGLSTLGLPASTLVVLRVAAKAISSIAVIWAAYRFVDILADLLSEKADRTDTKFDDLLVPLLTRSLKVFILTFGFVCVAEALNWNYKSILAGLGLGGLAFALAAKDTVSNIFGSITILVDRPFRIGDWIQVGDIDGSVESVGVRSTRIRTFYNSLITVPNSQLLNANIDNMGLRRYRRVKAMIAVTYDTPPEKIEAFCEGIRQLVREHPYTRKDYYHVYLNQFGAASLDILLYCFHETPDWSTELRERHRLFLDIIRLAQRLGVEFAFPTQTLYLRRESTDGPTAVSALPGTAEEAFVLGRAEASRIVEETQGKNAPKPPPVTIQAPPPDPQLGLDDE